MYYVQNNILLMSKVVFSFLFMISILHSIFAQNSRDIDNSANTSTQNKKSVKIFKSGKNNSFKTQEEGVKVYEDRMKQVAKDIKKSMRKLKKPQYSDKSYFGHKRPPKKRPLSRRKLCKVCGIVH